nr:carboxypeptidase-like regulatory domain-containing protein [Bacteroidota bacterium]
MNPKQFTLLLYGNNFKKLLSTHFSLFILFFFALASPAFSQITIGGKIKNENGVGVPQVSVVEKGKKNGAITSDDGSFTLSVKNTNASLIVS